jgi:acetylglutamate kinase
LTDRAGLLEDAADPDSLISWCDAQDIEQHIAKGTIVGGMKPKVESALRALEGGVGSVHIISAFQPSSLLLEVFTNEGCGTLIVKDKCETPQ